MSDTLFELHVDPTPQLATFLDTWAFPMLAIHVGPSLTCAEADALAALYRSVGQDDTAAAWLDAHSRGDTDPTDEHYGRVDS